MSVLALVMDASEMMFIMFFNWIKTVSVAKLIASDMM